MHNSSMARRPERRCLDDIVQFKEGHPRYSVFLRNNSVCRNFGLAWWRGNTMTIGHIRQNRVTVTDCGALMSMNTEMSVFGNEDDDVDYIDFLMRASDEQFVNYLKAALTAMCNVDFSIRHLLHIDEMSEIKRFLTVTAVEAHVVRGFEKRFDWFMQDVINLISDGLIRLDQHKMNPLMRSHELFVELREDPTVAIERDLPTYDLNRPLFSHFTTVHRESDRLVTGVASVLVSDKFRIDNRYLRIMQADGLETVLDKGGDLIKYLYSTYNEITQYITNKKRLAEAMGKTVMTTSDERYETWSQDPMRKEKIYVDMQPPFQPLEQNDFQPSMTESCHQRCVAYAAMAEKMKLSSLVLAVTDTVWRESQRLRNLNRSN